MRKFAHLPHRPPRAVVEEVQASPYCLFSIPQDPSVLADAIAPFRA